MTALLEELRGEAFAIAYRMTSSVGDAEDIAQETVLRYARARDDGTEVRSPRGWVAAAATRLAIDHLRSARVRREAYVGPWLPEPLVTDDAPGPAESVESTDALSQAFLLVLETLSPVERAVFLLHDVFAYEYGEIAGMVDKTEANCRQIGARARRHVAARRPRFEADHAEHERLLSRFIAAAQDGDVDGLRAVLAADAVFHSDGGGKAYAARRLMHGSDRIARLMTKVVRLRLEHGSWHPRQAWVNGAPGVVVCDASGAVTDVIAVDVADGAIVAVRTVRNPDKLRHVHFERGQTPPSKSSL